MSGMEAGSCSCDCDYGEGAEAWWDCIRKARKTWVCKECGENITPGTKYVESTSLFDGDFTRFRTCVPCDRIRTDFYSECGCWIAGRLRDDIRECWGFDYVTGEVEGWATEQDEEDTP